MCRAAEASIGLDRIAIVIVDYDQTDAIDWLPEGVTVINFAQRTSGLSVEQRTDVLAKFIQTARPRKVLNINSAITWDLYRDRGVFLSQHTRPYVYLFCRDFNDLGHPAGYADTHFRDAFNNLISVYFDNASFREELIDQFTFLPDDAKILQVVRQQIKPGLINRRNERPKNRGGIRVLWASRLTRQKNYKLLAKIINASPRHISFSVWGDGAASDMQEFRSLLAPGCNVEINGKFASFESLPLEQYDAYLYTSLWDGIPNAILEAAAYGFPVVASNVGGVREVVDPQNGWLIHDLRNPAAYVTALQEIANDIKGAWIKGDKLRSFVIATHSPEAALKILGATGEFLEADLAV
jgi:glycosyltransferase involved in cell wall biosynthesis